jgi:hypothetical protein
MKSLSRLVLAAALATGVSCSSITPATINVGDQCFRCRRTIIETRLAAEIVDPNGLAYKFRSSGCLAKYLADHPEDNGTIFVTDFATGRMMQTADATFVPVLLDSTTGERDFRAYRTKIEAEKVAKELGVTATDWAGVREQAPRS